MPSRADALLPPAPTAQVVLFSSVASLLGAAGQANYVAANAALDSWAAAATSAGQACTSIQWGAWAQAGMASQAVKARWAAVQALAGDGLAVLPHPPRAAACCPRPALKDRHPRLLQAGAHRPGRAGAAGGPGAA